MPQNAFPLGVVLAAVGGLLGLGADLLAVRWGGAGTWTLEPGLQQGYRWAGVALLTLGLAVSAAAAWWGPDRTDPPRRPSNGRGWAA